MGQQFDPQTVAFLKQLSAENAEKKQQDERRRTVEDAFTALRAHGFQLPTAVAEPGPATAAQTITGVASVNSQQQENDEMKKIIKQLQQEAETLKAEKRQETAVIERVEHSLTPDPKAGTLTRATKASTGAGMMDGGSMLTMPLQDFLQLRDQTRIKHKPKDPKERCVFDLSSAASGSAEDSKEIKATVEILDMLDEKLGEGDSAQPLRLGIHVSNAVEAKLKICALACAEKHLQSVQATATPTGLKDSKTSMGLNIGLKSHMPCSYYFFVPVLVGELKCHMTICTLTTFKDPPPKILHFASPIHLEPVICVPRIVLRFIPGSARNQLDEFALMST